MVDWELYWNAAGQAASAGSICMSGVVYCRFVKPFLTENRYTESIGIIYAAVMLLLKYIPWELDSMFCRALGAASGFAVMYVLDHKNLKQKVFLAVNWYLLEWMIWGIVLVPWGKLYQRLLLPPGMADQKYLQFVLFLLLQILYITCNYVGMTIFVRIIHKSYHSKKEKLSGRELVLMLAPSLAMLIGYGSFHYVSIAYEHDTGNYIWDIHRSFMWIRAFYMLISYGAVLAAVIVYQHLKDIQRKETGEAVLTRQMEDMKKHINEVEQLYLDIRGLKHDMRNHVMILEHLYHNLNTQTDTEKDSGRCPPDLDGPGIQNGTGDNSERARYLQDSLREAEQYLVRFKSQVDEVTREIQSGNPVTDVILREKQKEAREKGIAFICRFCYPDCRKISAFDVGIVLNNAVNNAIEAAEECEEAYIIIASYCKKHAFILEIKNSVNGMRYVDGETNLPVTTKNGADHGFGFSNIQKVAQQYFGDIDIEQDGKEFVVRVMFMLEFEAEV